MPIIVCGINYKTAPIELREKVIFHQERLALYLTDLRTQEGIQEAVILSTCNRSELYCDANDTDQLVAWFCRQHQVEIAELKSALYIYRADAAIAHIMQVACGLDSMILGEPQILGQMKTAFSESCVAGMVGPVFNRLFQQVFVVAKEVRTHTAIGACPVSVASAAVSFTKKLYSDLRAARVLVIGAGDTAELVLRYLQMQTPAKISICNRNSDNALRLAQQYQAHNIPFTSLTAALADADIVITATGSSLPIITRSMLQAVVAKRNTMLVIMDLAVPRDVEPAAAELPLVQLRCIDDLKEIIQHNLRGREHAAEKAREIIHNKASEFAAWSASLDMVATTIRAYRKQIEAMSQTELAKAAGLLQRGDDPLQVLALFANALTNKLLHTPSVQLRQAGVEGRLDVLRLAQQLFALRQVESELL